MTPCENEKSRIRYKIDVFKSVIGTLWENYVLKNNNEIAEFVKNYAYSAVTANVHVGMKNKLCK